MFFEKARRIKELEEQVKELELALKDERHLAKSYLDLTLTSEAMIELLKKENTTYRTGYEAMVAQCAHLQDQNTILQAQLMGAYMKPSTELENVLAELLAKSSGSAEII